MSLVVIYAIGQEAAADTYLAFCNLNAPEHATDPNSIWDIDTKLDRYGQRVVGYLGVGGRADLTEEPAGGEEARGPGVLQEGFDAPEGDDEL